MGRPVKARAARSAIIVASVPDAAKRTSSAEGRRSTIISARSASPGDAPAQAVPSASCRAAASITCGTQLPRIIAV
jgi:hypothetical protein